MTVSFSPAEIERYQRQAILPEWGAAGQARVRVATVTLEGAGPGFDLCARYLAAAGVGELRLAASVDAGHIDGSEGDRVAVAARALNPFVQVHNVVPEGLVQAHQVAPGGALLEPAGPNPSLPPSAASARVVSGDGTIQFIVAADARAATGCALAVEVLKAILALPFRSRVDLSADLSPDGPICDAPRSEGPVAAGGG